ncbi:hypothetical protein LI328DRAFT_136042 [Trichoderma asperelloides]|nr:hypothetical protein LI328DRAFT_136042 [Trichoderma asperelloides]
MVALLCLARRSALMLLACQVAASGIPWSRACLSAVLCSMRRFAGICTCRCRFSSSETDPHHQKPAATPWT